jgi:divalent metal cation (Fe/Co/Zn/Cd) transporter
MASVLQTASPDAIRRIQRVQTVTIAWMSVEAVVSLFAAWRARSPALLAFGGDSATELFSAVVVLWRFLAGDAHEDVERRAARVAGALLFGLAAYVAITSVASLLGYSEPKPTLLGIAILVAAALVIALAGLAINGIWHLKWADPVAALAVLPLIVLVAPYFVQQFVPADDPIGILHQKLERLELLGSQN